MSKFEFHTLESAPDAARPLLQGVKNKMKFIPNLYLGLANAPAALEAYLTMSDIIARTSFSFQEQQVIMLAASVENDCGYCVAAHSSGARMLKVDKTVIEAVRNDEPIDDDKLQALRSFVQAVVVERGKVDSELEYFLAAGYNQSQALEVIFAVAMKTLSNYANHLLDTPVDDVLAAMAWGGRQSKAMEVFVG